VRGGRRAAAAAARLDAEVAKALDRRHRALGAARRREN
jgi:hypothetical protein